MIKELNKDIKPNQVARRLNVTYIKVKKIPNKRLLSDNKIHNIFVL